MATTSETAGSADLPPKPLPVPDEASQPYFDGAAQGKLLLRHCRACGEFMAPSGGVGGVTIRPVCMTCYSMDVEWAPSSGKGVLYSFAIMHQLYDSAFAADIPYNISVVELEEGVRLTANMVGCSNDDLKIGMPVEVVFDKLSPDITVPKFAPA